MTTTEERKPFVVVPYIHGILHNLRKIGARARKKMVMSAPNKLIGMCAKMNCEEKRNQCKKKHQTKYFNSMKNVVYQIPLL